MGESIPVIDLEKISEQSEWKKLRDACEKWGCFRIINHSIPLTLMAEMKTVVVALHELPIEIKKNNKDVIPGSGFMVPSALNPLLESFGLYDTGSSQAIQDFCSQLNATPHQRQIMETYGKAINVVAEKVAQKIAESLGIMDADFDDWPFQYRINKYNFTPETIGSFGGLAHTDSGLLTIVQADENVDGLEVMDSSGSFVSIPPCHGTLLVMLGDMAPVWSNGRFSNVKHQIKCKDGTARYSIAAFLLAPRKENIEAPKELVDHDHPRLYRPFTYQEYRELIVGICKGSVEYMHTGQALELLRLV